jgi:biotin carboxylase
VRKQPIREEIITATDHGATEGNRRHFVRALAEVGATVIGLGESPADALDEQLKGWLHRYELVPSVTDVEAMTRQVRWAQDRLWVDRIEATIEAHTLATAHVREACTIPGTSVRTAWLCRDKPSMKQVLREAGVPTATPRSVTTCHSISTRSPRRSGTRCT